MKQKILIVDDKKSVLTALEMLLQTTFEKVLTLSNPNLLVSTIKREKVDIVLLDMNFKTGRNTGNEGIFWLNEINKIDPSIVVIMITAYGDIELAVRTVKEGAFNFILKPWDNKKLLATIHSAIRLRQSQMENQALKKSGQELIAAFSSSDYSIIGRSQAIQDVMQMVKKVAQTDANVLITGENGTGKELIAKEIHKHSKRRDKILMSIDMGAISESLFESELFGHKKGAFTDAKNDRTGKLEMAHKGTVFLDEIGNLSLTMQAKLLSVLENRTITKVGDNIPVPIDIRLIAATNKNLSEMIQNGQFREDLLYRINTISIELPPLRKRGNDVLLLAEFYLQKYVRKYGKPKMSIDDKAREKLLQYAWPGNVRELKHSIEKAVILAEGTVLNETSFTLDQPINQPESLENITLDEMEKMLIINTIKKYKGNMSRVAKKLGITRQTLYNKLKKYDI